VAGGNGLLLLDLSQLMPSIVGFRSISNIERLLAHVSV
jgi:hypothetical protein